MKKTAHIFLAFAALFSAINTFAQTDDELKEIYLDRPRQSITTALPFLTIAPDSRSGGMGETGVATTTDVWSMNWNPSKYAFSEDQMSVGIAYTPWLRNIGVTDVNLAYLGGYYKIDDLQTVAATLRYFALGEIVFLDEDGEETGYKHSPNEFALSGAYARKLSDHFSLSVAGRFIYSNLLGNYVQDGETSKPGVTGAVDFSGLYKNEMKSAPVNYAIGFNFSNIGAKLGYSDSDSKEFIPTNMKIGAGGDYQIDDYNKAGFYLDVNKLLVPTPPATVGGEIVAGGKDPSNIPLMEGIFTSFGDAPGGFQEELREFQISVGGEYWYDEQFAIRAGYFHENAKKGNRKYYTIGLGLRMNVFGLDLAYLVPTQGKQSPLANTVRFSLVFDFEGLKDEQKDKVD